MKIKNVSCTQFAGIRDRNISFEDGINVIFGKNESGKSTVVNLISQTLFRDARLDGRRDKDFFDLYLPAARRGSSVTGDFADGKISFESSGGLHTLTKEWGADARCTLSTPEGIVRDRDTVFDILSRELVYGKGVWTDMLLSSQHNTDLALQMILDATKKTDTKQELVDAVSQAFSESDGISADAISEAISAKIDELAGKHWDVERSLPARKAGRWANGLGEVLKAYYALEDAEDVLNEISRLEQDAAHSAAVYAEKDAAAHAAEDAYIRFNTFSSQIAVQSERKKAIERIERELSKTTEILKKWPIFEKHLASAKLLHTEKHSRAVLDKYISAKAIIDEIAMLDTSLLSLPYPSSEEIAQVNAALRKIQALENTLCGMNLTMVTKMFGENELIITSCHTGERIELTNGSANITEAITLTIPGVAELSLSPSDVDVASAEASLSVLKSTVNSILEKYGVDSVETLEALAKRISDTSAKSDALNLRLATILGNTSFDELTVSLPENPESIRSNEEIENEIRTVCSGRDISDFIASVSAILDGYTTEYHSINDLKASAFDLNTELEKANTAVALASDIPEEYAGISDPETYLEQLRSKFKTYTELRDEALAKKTSAASLLESYKENIASEPKAEVEKARLIFEEKKSLLHHWLHISEVFKTQREALSDNPMQDIAENFAHYLEIISDGGISSEFPDGDRLDMNIYSTERLLDYGKLSEGTKDTVSLAFRFAVLDHLFPEGGGVIVLDDPLTDMDAERDDAACRLIQDAATRHQIIFLTCHEEYLTKLGGNSIIFR